MHKREPNQFEKKPAYDYRNLEDAGVFNGVGVPSKIGTKVGTWNHPEQEYGPPSVSKRKKPE